MGGYIDQVDGFWDLLERRAEASPDTPMLIEDSGRTLTFGEIRDRALRTAAGCAAMGIGEGTPVVWQLPTRIESIIFSLALARLGAVQTPVLHLYRDKEVGFCIQQARPALVAGPGEWGGLDYTEMHTRLSDGLDPAPQILVAYDTLPDGDPDTLPPVPSSDGEPIRWVYYTSGTTSDPKGVRHTDLTLISAGIGLAEALEVGPDDVGSMAFPFTHIAGPDYLAMLLVAGFPAILLESFAPAAALEAFRTHGATIAGGSTAFYTMFLGEQRASGSTDPIVPSLTMLAGGGAPKPPDLYYEVKEEMGIPIAHGYGMTECPMIAQGRPSDTDEQLANTDGAPVRGCEITIVTADETVAAPGEEGEIRVTGPMLFKGYTDESLNDAAFDDAGRFRTGDLGRLSEDGHVSLTGRLKDVIIRKGENVSAKEVEDVLFSHPKVGDVAVIGLIDRERGERVCAVVETAEGQEPLTFEEMVAHCEAAKLMRQKTPEQLEVMDALPRNETLRKVLKYQLRDQFNAVPWP